MAVFNSVPIPNHHTQQLLTAFEASTNGWLNRKAIATHLGKKRLTPSNIRGLEKLSMAGLLEVRKQANDSFIGYEWQYRLIAPTQNNSH